MNKEFSPTKEQYILEREHFPALLDVLGRKGYSILGPTIGEGAIVYGELTSEIDLPSGWTDRQEGGTYRLVKRSDRALFSHSVGPHSWKQFLCLPDMRLWRGEVTGDGFRVKKEAKEDRPAAFAFIGVRACDLHALAIHDKVFINERYADPEYHSRRRDNLIVVVNCTQAGGTCFCASMNTGPRATFGFDLALTEVIDDDRHYFLIEVGTKRGWEVLGEITHAAAHEEEKRAADSMLANTAAHMGRSMDTTDIQALLYRNYEHPRWDEVASRCLTCGNCTLVCPTCFCSTMEDFTSLDGKQAQRIRRWDSCFTLDFSYIHGGSIRVSPKARYRQWMVHKLATWIDQFGTSGCVGCGRCITWCPVGIDLTEEVNAIRGGKPRGKTVISAGG